MQSGRPFSKRRSNSVPAFAIVLLVDSLFLTIDFALSLYLPAGEGRRHPTRVIERVACAKVWYEVETWHENVKRWVMRMILKECSIAHSAAQSMAWLEVGEEV